MIVRKRTLLRKEKRRIKIRPRPPRERETRFDESLVENPNEVLVDMNELADLALIGDEVADPDASVLAQQEELLEEEPLDLRSPQLAAELADDPVRLYLREIGQVKLLDSDSEFRLATIIEASRFVVMLRRRPPTNGLTFECSIYHAILDEMY